MFDWFLSGSALDVIFKLALVAVGLYIAYSGFKIGMSAFVLLIMFVFHNPLMRLFDRMYNSDPDDE